jgi:hypothetical protein
MMAQKKRRCQDSGTDFCLYGCCARGLDVCKDEPQAFFVRGRFVFDPKKRTFTFIEDSREAM